MAIPSRTEAIQAAIRAELERHRSQLDAEPGLERVDVSVKLNRRGQPVFVQFRPLIERCLTDGPTGA